MIGRIRPVFSIFFLIPLLALGACGTLRTISGLEKNSPDEFAVVTRPPLIIPPEYTLTPPEPGEARPQNLASSVETLRALFPDNPDVTPQVSAAEQALLRSIEAQPLADIRSNVSDGTEVVEKGTLLEDIVAIEEREDGPDGSSIDHIASEEEDGEG